MKGFKTIRKDYIKEKNNEDAWDSRQKLIEGWDADAIKNATVLIAGAGAIGNEVIKNLALLGFGNMIICDLDIIEGSNLTRTVLFSENDIGLEKAKLAAKRSSQMNLEKTSVADGFSGDIVYELGDGIFRHVDIVFGCLDNIETRRMVNKICMRYDIPFLDAGIGSFGYNLEIFNGHLCGCYECFATDSKYKMRFRKSCDVTKKEAATHNLMATVQTTSAMVAGLQVQEALKILCDNNPKFGYSFHFEGLSDRFEVYENIIDPNCMQHMMDARTNIVETELSYNNSLREFLQYILKDGYDVLSVKDDDFRNFVKYVKCPNCGTEKKIFQPLFKVFSDDFYCDDCTEKHNKYDNYIDDISVTEFSLESTEDEILDMKLKDLGIPAFHVLCVGNSKTEELAFYELTADMSFIIPNYYNKNISPM